MNNGSIYKPEHIRENLRYYSPGITEHSYLCLECGYCGLMGFTTTNHRGLKTYCNTIFWGLIALLSLIVAISSEVFLHEVEEPFNRSDAAGLGGRV